MIHWPKDMPIEEFMEIQLTEPSMTPLEQATQAAVEQSNQLRADIRLTAQLLKESQEREAILKGRIEQLEKDLVNAEEWSDYHLRCATEIAMQLHNVGIFVSDALHTAKEQVGKNNGQGKIQSAYDKVEAALSITKTEVGHEPVQHKGER